MSYLSTDRLCRGGAPVKNLSHSASFHCWLKKDPSNTGTKQLASKLKAGTVYGNCHAMINTALSSGGFEESGIGREQGGQGIEAYLETGTVIIKM